MIQGATPERMKVSFTNHDRQAKREKEKAKSRRVRYPRSDIANNATECYPRRIQCTFPDICALPALFSREAFVEQRKDFWNVELHIFKI